MSKRVLEKVKTLLLVFRSPKNWTKLDKHLQYKLLALYLVKELGYDAALYSAEAIDNPMLINAIKETDTKKNIDLVTRLARPLGDPIEPNEVMDDTTVYSDVNEEDLDRELEEYMASRLK